jgi:hypothetical protein
LQKGIHFASALKYFLAEEKEYDTEKERLAGKKMNKNRRF